MWFLSWGGVFPELDVDGTYAAARLAQLLHLLRQRRQTWVLLEVQPKQRLEVPELLRHPLQLGVFEVQPS